MMQCAIQDRSKENEEKRKFIYKGQKVKLVKYGIANQYGHHIEIHEKIYHKYPELYEKIMDHEVEHTEGITWKDILLDSFGCSLPVTQLRQFLFTTPSAWIQFIPVWFKFKPKFDVVINPMLLAYWVFVILFAIIILLV